MLIVTPFRFEKDLDVPGYLLKSTRKFLEYSKEELGVPVFRPSELLIPEVPPPNR